MASKTSYAQYYRDSIPGCIGGGADYRTIEAKNTEDMYLYVKPVDLGIPVGSTITNIEVSFQYRTTTTSDASGAFYKSTLSWRPVRLTPTSYSGTEAFGTPTELGSQETIKTDFGHSTSYNSTGAKSQNVNSITVDNNILVGARIIIQSKNVVPMRFWLQSVSFTVTYTEPHFHSYTTETARTASTCCTKGSVTKKCSCGATQTTELALDPNNHAGGTEIRNAVAATCTTTGYTGDTYCKGCGAKLSSGSATQALGHSYKDTVVAPTTNSHGYTEHTCTRCGHSYRDNYFYIMNKVIGEGCDYYLINIVSGSKHESVYNAYSSGSVVEITAYPKDGYVFSQWEDGSTDNPRYITMTSDVTAQAYFKRMCTISTAVSPTGGGSVTGGGTYEYGTSVTLTAVPATGYYLSDWLLTDTNGDSLYVGSSNINYTINAISNYTVTAIFEKLTYRVRWYNEDGSKLLETDSAVPYGTMPTYNGATPTKSATAQYTYKHIGWAVSPTATGTTALTAVVSNIDYYARFSSTIKKYTVTWKNDDGTVLETDTLVPYGTPPDYNGATPTKSSTAQYDYTFLGWSAKVEDPPLEEGNLPTVSGNITYTAVYLPVVRKYDLDLVAYDCTVEGAVSGTYEYGTEFTITVKPDFGYEFVRITDVEYDTEYTDNILTFILTGNTTLHCVCERLPAPIFASSEQQVKDIYIVPAINTIVYIIDGDLPTLEVTMDTVDDLHFSVINTDMDSSEYADYLYYPIEQLYVNDKDGNSTRVW